MHRNKSRVFIALAVLSGCASRRPSLTAKDAFRPTADFVTHVAEVARDVRTRTQRDGTLRAFRPVVSPGGVDLLNDRPRESFEADRAPWWWDVFFTEAQGLMLAQQNGWRAYRAGACLDAYRGALAQTPTSPTDEKESESAEFPAGVPFAEGEEAPYRAAFAKALGENEEIERVAKLGEGRFVVETGEGRILEFRRVETRTPLNELGPELQGTRENWASPCQRFLETWKALRRPGRGVCLTARGEAYALAPWLEPLFVEIEKPEDLAARLGARCADFGASHARQMDSTQRRALEVALRGNPLLRERVLARAREISEVWIENYRIKLQSGGGSP